VSRLHDVGGGEGARLTLPVFGDVGTGGGELDTEGELVGGGGAGGSHFDLSRL